MNKITGKNVKPDQINKIFDVKKVDSNNKQDKLNDDLMQIIILCPIKKEK